MKHRVLGMSLFGGILGDICVEKAHTLSVTISIVSVQEYAKLGNKG